ncbi:uncharacterized protein LOC126671845 [Mercurialis annua]|uniref:uncharacterized protein LOC126671845 n=1 Tax=Mercurialis annua TaxID=3986 RepID=UPI00215DDEE4|nr:uncharacterized protein LOC126671845 [Mercurialis annua]
MQYFINLIGSEFDFSLDIEQLRSLEQWALNHVAIMISEDRLAFLQDIYQKYQAGTPKIQNDFEDVFISMGRKDKWASRMNSITMGAIQACYHNHLDNSFIGYVDNPTTSLQIIVSNRSMIKCWRNLAIHLLDVGKDYHAKGSFTPLNMDLMIMATFDKEITICQKFLHFKNLLRKIKTGRRVAYGVNKKIFVS